jgi:hypothetical protein
MSYFTNIAVKNVNKGFVYITDLTWPLNVAAPVIYDINLDYSPIMQDIVIPGTSDFKIFLGMNGP